MERRVTVPLGVEGRAGGLADPPAARTAGALVGIRAEVVATGMGALTRQGRFPMCPL
jgi:hypothetical protein